jgi:transcriptional regulator with XRE-family HTH domain
MSSDKRLEELPRFLKTRRERIKPADVGLPATGRRRVPGLRREEVAALAGIGVSWYTALENGDARGVSETTLAAVADALRLSDSERQYLFTLAGATKDSEAFVSPSQLVLDTMHAISFPAYILDAAWEVQSFNDPFRRVWAIADEVPPFNAVERLFVHPVARAMHGERFEANIRPVIAMLRSSQGRRPYIRSLRESCDRLIRDAQIKRIWDQYEISNPLVSNTVTVDSPLGRFSYETLTLPISGTSGIVVQVPDLQSRGLLERTSGV